jgi:hypothetical protein
MHFLKKQNNRHQDLGFWLDEFEKELIGSGIISTSLDRSVHGSLDLKGQMRSWFVVFVSLLGMIRHSLNLTALGIKDKKIKRLLIVIGGDIFHGFGFASPACNAVGLFGSSINFIDRTIFLWAERDKLLFPLYSFYPCKESTPKKLHLKRSSCRKLRDSLCLVVQLLRIAFPLSFFSYAALQVIACLITDAKETRLFQLFSVVHLADQLLNPWYGIRGVMQTQSLMFLSMKYTSLRISEITSRVEKIQCRRRCVEDDKKLNRNLQEVIDIFKMVHRYNHLISYLVRNTIVLVCPLASFVMVVMTTDVPSWFPLLLIFGATPVIFAIQMALYSIGSLFLQAKFLLNLLHSVQADMAVEHKYAYITHYRVLQIIKLLSSDRISLFFSLPDGRFLTPSTSFSFIASTMSNTFLVLDTKASL